MVWDDRFQPLTRDEDFWGEDEPEPFYCPGCGEPFPLEHEPEPGERCAECFADEEQP